MNFINKVIDFFLGKKVDTGFIIGDKVTLKNPADEVSYFAYGSTIFYFEDYIITKIFRNGDIAVKNLKGKKMPKRYSYKQYCKV